MNCCVVIQTRKQQWQITISLCLRTHNVLKRMIWKCLRDASQNQTYCVWAEQMPANSGGPFDYKRRFHLHTHLWVTCTMAAPAIHPGEEGLESLLQHFSLVIITTLGFAQDVKTTCSSNKQTHHSWTWHAIPQPCLLTMHKPQIFNYLHTAYIHTYCIHTFLCQGYKKGWRTEQWDS